MLKQLSVMGLILLFVFAHPLTAMEYDKESSDEEPNVFKDDDYNMPQLSSLEDRIKPITSDYTSPIANDEESAISAALDELQFGASPSVKKNVTKRRKKNIQKKINPSFPIAFPAKNNDLIQVTHDIKEVRDICVFAIHLIASLEANGSEEEKENMLKLLNEKQTLAIEALQKIDQIENPTAYFLENFSSSIPQTVDNFLQSLGYILPEDTSCKL